MPVVACPKCKKKYKLSEAMLGKTVQCSQCKTKFKTAAAKSNDPDAAKVAKDKRRTKKTRSDGDGRTGASKASLKDVGLSGKLSPQFDLFSQPIPDKRAPNPLGNYVLEDPGFGDADTDDVDEIEEDEVEVNDDMKQLLANPALKSLAKAQRKKKDSRTIAKPSDFKEIKILGYFIVALGAMAILCYLVAAVSDGMTLASGDSISPEVVVVDPDTGEPVDGGSDGDIAVEMDFPVGALLSLVGLGFSVLCHILALFYWWMSNANATSLGAKDLSYTPLWMVLSWFIPFANLLWPMQGITETYKASLRPSGKKWQRVKATLWQAPVWTVAIIASAGCDRASARIEGQGVATFTSRALDIGGTVLGAVAVFCVISIVMAVTKAQYDNFKK